MTNLAGYCTHPRRTIEIAFGLFLDGPGQRDRVRAGGQDGRRDRPLLKKRPWHRTIKSGVQLTSALNLRELQRYLSRIGDRWPLQLVMLGGARVADLRRPAPPPRSRGGPEYVVVLVSDGL